MYTSRLGSELRVFSNLIDIYIQNKSNHILLIVYVWEVRQHNNSDSDDMGDNDTSITVQDQFNDDTSWVVREITPQT